jgi:hypothetical protein
MSAVSPNLNERVQRTLDENKQALRKSRRDSATRERNAKQSRLVVSRAVNRLKRAGLLK